MRSISDDTENMTMPPRATSSWGVTTNDLTARAADVGGVATIGIGIDAADRKLIGDGLSKVLADTHTLYLKTRNYHWNVVGPLFQTLHLMFEEEYNELALAVDDIAERIRALGERAPGSSLEFSELSSIPEEIDQPEATEMIRRLVAGHETAARTARSILPSVAAAGDEPTADLLTQRLLLHEKTAWMLRSMLA